jgi:hypothetical protein
MAAFQLRVCEGPMRDSAWFMRPTFQQKFTRVNIEIYVRKVS